MTSDPALISACNVSKVVVTKKVKMSQKEAGKTFTLKELIGTLHDTENTKDKKAEPDSNLDVSVTIHKA